MDTLLSLLEPEIYTPTTFKSWTDGPKCIIDTMNLVDTIDTMGVSSVMNAPSEIASRTELERFRPGDVSTIYFLNDANMAGLAIMIRPDLNITLLQIEPA